MFASEGLKFNVGHWICFQGIPFYSMAREIFSIRTCIETTYSIAMQVQLEKLGGVTSIRNKRWCAILTSKVVPKIPGIYLKLRPKNPRTRNIRLFILVNKLITQIRKSKDFTISLCFTMFVLRVLNFLQLLSVQVTTYKMHSKINIILPL